VPTDSARHQAMTQVVVTRPEQDASAWIDSLNEAGFKTTRFPLLQLTEFLTTQTALEALALLKRSQAVMFVSANAVRFLAHALRHHPDWVDHFQVARALGARVRVQRPLWRSVVSLPARLINLHRSHNNSIQRPCGMSWLHKWFKA